VQSHESPLHQLSSGQFLRLQLSVAFVQASHAKAPKPEQRIPEIQPKGKQ
jgi:hypothetical protein